MNGFEKLKLEHEEQKQNKFQKQPHHKILQKILEQNNIKEAQRKKEFNQPQVQEDEIITSTNDLESFKAVLEKMSSKKQSQQTPPLQFLSMQNNQTILRNQLRENQDENKNNQSQIQQENEEQKIRPSLKSKTQKVPKLKKVFDFKQYEENRLKQKEQEVQNIQNETISDLNPQSSRQELINVENMIGKALIQIGEKPLDNIRITQNLYDMIEPKPINANKFEKYEEEKIEIQNIQLQNFESIILQPLQKFNQNCMFQNKNNYNKIEKKPTITELFYMDQSNQKYENDFENENNYEILINQKMIQPKLQQKFQMNQILNEETKQIQPRNIPSKFERNSQFQNEQIENQTQKQISFGISKMIPENKLSEKQTETNENQDEEMNDDLNKYQSPIFKKTLAKMPSIDLLEIENTEENNQKSDDFEKSNHNDLLLFDNINEIMNIEDKEQDTKFGNFLNVKNDQQKQSLELQNKNTDDMYKYQNNRQQLQIEQNKIHYQQYYEEEKKEEINYGYSMNPFMNTNKLGDNFLPCLEKRKTSYSQYCPNKREINESIFGKLNECNQLMQIKKESDDQQKSQKQFQDLNSFDLSLNQREEDNFEGQDTLAFSSDLDHISINNHKIQFNTSSPKQQNTLNYQEFSRKQKYEIGLGSMSQFDAINRQEEMVKETATDHNEEECNHEFSSQNFQIGLELAQQNSSSSFEIQKMPSASRKRINSFDKNNLSFNRTNINNQEIEIQMNVIQPQPLRRQNAFVERNQQHNQTDITQVQEPLITINSEQSVEQLEANRLEALRNEFQQDSFDIDEEELLLQHQQLQLVRGGFSSRMLPTNSNYLSQRLTRTQNINHASQQAESQIQILQLEENTEFQSETDLTHQNENLTFEESQNITNSIELNNDSELPGLQRSTNINLSVVNVGQHLQENFSSQESNTQIDSERFINMMNEINQRQIISDSQNNSDVESYSPQKNLENDFCSLQDLDMKNLSFQAQFQYAHPKWIAEIQDNMNEKVFQRCKDIIQNLGALGLLIFVRLFIINENFIQEQKVINKKKIENQEELQDKIWTETYIESCEQISFNSKSQKKGIQCMTQKFLIQIAQRMINIVHFERNKNKFIMNQIKKGQFLDKDSKQIQDIQMWNNFSEIKDKVLPPIEEIYYCIKNKLMNKKEILLYKMILDLNDALLNPDNQSNQNEFQNNQDQIQIKKLNNVFVPCAQMFYKQLNEQEVNQLVNKMQEINKKINYQIELDDKMLQMNKLKSSTYNHQYSDALQKSSLQILKAENYISGSSLSVQSEFLEDDLTQMILDPVQYFLKENPLNCVKIDSQIFRGKKINENDENSYCFKIENKLLNSSQNLVVLQNKREYESFYKNMEINMRNQMMNCLDSNCRGVGRNVSHLLVNDKRGSAAITSDKKVLESLLDRQKKDRGMANKSKMPWNKKKNILMHNGSYFLKNVLV